MFLRVIKCGVTTNIPIGDEYTKLDVCQLHPGSPIGDCKIKELIHDFDLCGNDGIPKSNIIVVLHSDEDGHIRTQFQLEVGVEYYIVQPDGRTYEQIHPKKLSPVHYRKTIAQWKDEMGL